MNSTPMLQVAMDYISLPKALAMAVLVAPEVDIIEIGTPLCKAAGIEAVRAMREICPDKLILADLKTPDVGGLEATMAFDAGADMMTVIGGAALSTVEQALAVARKRGKEMLMELTGVRDILARATEWRRIGVDRIVYHREWDAQSAGREWTEEDKDYHPPVDRYGLQGHGDRRNDDRSSSLLRRPACVRSDLRTGHSRGGRSSSGRPPDAAGPRRFVVKFLCRCPLASHHIGRFFPGRTRGQGYSLGRERDGAVFGRRRSRVPRL